MSYDLTYKNWIDDPISFWEERAENISWIKKWDKVLDDKNKPFYSWFPGGELNTCYNCVDRHVLNGRGDKNAIIYDSPITNKKTALTYYDLKNYVSKAAGALVELGVIKGDRVLIYMPMIPETIVSMLACARIGAIHSVVFGGFAASELASRINDAEPKVIIAGSCGLEPGKIINYKNILDKAISYSDVKPSKCIIYQREELECTLIKDRDYNWEELINKAKEVDCQPVLSTDPLYILYTSGTTGVPKGIVRDNGGHAVALMNTMKMTYGMEKNDVFWAASDVGWVVGHSYIVYAPLLYGNTSILYEGKPVGTPNAEQFWRVIDEHKVSVMFTAPTAMRAIRREDPNGKLINKYKMKSFRNLFLAGERADPETVEWLQKKLSIPVIDHWWQTETGWSIAGNFVDLGLFPIKPGSTGKAAPGYIIHCLDKNSNKLKANQLGTLAIKLPLPPGCSPTIWKNYSLYKESYLKEFPGYYSTSDAGFIDDDDYISVMARTDDIINCAGHRLSTGSMEEVISKHQDVAECAVVGIKDKLKGQIPIGFLVLNNNCISSHEEIINQTVKSIRDSIGAVASYKKSIVVNKLPKTRSGKILRKTISLIVDREKYEVPATIEDSSALDEIIESIK